MKTLLRILLLTGAATFICLTGYTQNQFFTYHIKVPPLAPGRVYAVALSDLGLKNTNHSVLVKVRLPGDTTYYAIPGVLPTGDSFSFRLEPGNRTQSDTLYVIRRGGNATLRQAEIVVMAFHRKYRAQWPQPERSFTKAVLTRYHDTDIRLHARSKADVRATFSENPAALFPIAVLMTTNQSNKGLFQK